MGIVFSCCLNLKDPPTENLNASIPVNDCCFGILLHKCKQLMQRNEFEPISSTPTSPSSATPILQPQFSSDTNFHVLSQPQSSISNTAVPNPRIVLTDWNRPSDRISNTKVQSSEQQVSTLVPDRTSVGATVACRQTDEMPSSEQQVSVLAPERTEVIPSSEGAFNSRAALTLAPDMTPVGATVVCRQTEVMPSSEQQVSALVPERTQVMPSSEAAFNSRATEPLLHGKVSVPEDKGACHEKHSFPAFYDDLYEQFLSSDEEDVCPICLDDYDPENPRIITECSHHFHLGCIYAWMERSNTCPNCFRVMVFKEAE